MTAQQRWNLAAFVEALREEQIPNTGESITKIEGKLKEGAGDYCVWGVGCEIYGANKGIGWRDVDGEGYTFLGHEGEPPEEILKYYGIDTGEVLIPVYLQKRVERVDMVSPSLIELNDDTDLTFPELADVIEYNYLMTAKQRKRFDLEHPSKEEPPAKAPRRRK